MNGIYETKARLNLLIDNLTEPDEGVEEELSAIRKSLSEVKRKLTKYDVPSGLARASQIVNDYMNDVAKHFPFEKGYKPTNLHFSFEDFTLYHETPGDKKIYLRSMGSGANWLYSHVSLFLALHRYFASLGDSCAIPSVLFFDQPTQVYFPNFRRDDAPEFNKGKIQEIEYGEGKSEKIDEDIEAVEGLFSQLSIYCKTVRQESGFSPQIIVTDHADHLNLSDGIDFETLVNGNRWRRRGLIDPV
ncbi:MAG: DUF3732 domain-containing protein [Cellvibrionales bacterium]|nr:DUF3732 domain-containing protein [Cellvibrionales bacterium]